MSDANNKEYELPNAYGQFLRRSFIWSHFGTLTFRYPVSRDSAMRQFMYWLARITKNDAERIGWFVAVEQPSEGLAHIHFLLYVGRGTSCRTLKEEWRSGYAQVARYDSRRAAAYYVSKGVGRSGTEYDFTYPHRL